MKLPFSDLHAFRRDPLGFFLETGVNADEPLVRLRMGPWPTYLVADPNLIKPILKADPADIEKGQLVYKLREILGESSFIITGEEHRKRRSAIHNQLARGVVSSYVPLISDVIRGHAAGLAAQGQFDAHKATAVLAVRVIAAVLFGKGALSAADEEAIIQALYLAEDDLNAEMFRILPDLPWVKKRKKERLNASKSMMEVIVGRAQHRASDDSLLAGLRQLNLSDKALQEEVLLLLLSGHHTSGTAAAWILYFLATVPGLAAEIAAEAQSMMTPDGEIDPKMLPRAQRSIALVKETLRLYPSAYWMSRETMRPVELGGRKLPKGVSLLISPWHMHRDAKFWDNPDEFNLDRDHRGPAYVPFGAGHRVCVGMGLGLLELQLIALEFALAFDITLLTPQPLEAPRPAITILPPPMELQLAARRMAAPFPRATAA